MIFLIIGYTLFVFVGGIAIGASLVRDWLDGLVSKPAPPAPLPRMWLEQIAKPAVWRRSPSQLAAHRAVFGKRQAMPIIDIEVR